jgi:hypothetical protein
MKTKIINSILFIMIFLSGKIQAQNASLQVIHNAADPAAALVDIYVDGTLTANDFAFRTASSFLSLTSNVVHNVGVAPSNSMSAMDTIKNFQINLAPGGRYVAIANGVLTPGSFATNPDAASTAFNLYIKDSIQAAAVNPSNVDFIVMHGATDAPTVDVLARGVASLVNDASYGAITDYIGVPADSYILDVTPGNSNSTIVASFQADLTTLAGGTAVVVASGFLDPTLNQNGPAFGLWAYLASGGPGIQFPAVSLARLQVIHNAADPAADTVDVYLNGAMLKDDFVFRTATPYIDAPAGVLLNIGIAPANSTSVADTIKNFQATLANGNSYLAVANGVITPGSFAPNPNSVSTAFTLFIQDAMREGALVIGDVDLRVVHGSTDAPTVDVIARGVGEIVDSASYSNITNYINVPANSYILDITPHNAPSTIVASYLADLSSLGGGAGVVVASGFLDSTLNQNGPAFGLWAYLPDGTGIQLPAVSQARIQVIHNAADPAAATVDVYLNGTLLKDNFAFRTATPYIDAPAGVLLNIGIAPGNSTSVADTIKNFQATLENGKTYVAIANGVLSPGSFAVNPDAVSTAFTLFIQDAMRESALLPGDVDIRVVHGSTDAPTVDVLAQGVVTPLVDDASYSDITPYLSVAAGNYILDITPGNNNALIVASFAANLTSLAGGAAVVLASGFLNPATNQNGPAFVLMAVLPDGQVIILNNVTSIEEESANSFRMYPNPATEKLNVEFTDNNYSSIKVSVLDMTGRLITSSENTVLQNRITLNTSGLVKGNYVLKLENNGKVLVRRFNVL